MDDILDSDFLNQDDINRTVILTKLAQSFTDNFIQKARPFGGTLGQSVVLDEKFNDYLTKSLSKGIALLVVGIIERDPEALKAAMEYRGPEDYC